MTAFNTERVLSVHHWNDTLFSFKTTRDQGLRFHNGHFVMIGLEVDGRPLVRAYSIASPNYDEHLEFLSIKVQDGALTKSKPTAFMCHPESTLPGAAILWTWFVFSAFLK